MMQKRSQLVITIIAILGMGIATLLGMLLVTDFDLSSEEGTALVKGRYENGYPYVGYIISDKSRVCAGTLIDATTVLTAGHCLNYEAGSRFSFGTGEFTTNTRELTAIKLVKFAPGYNPETDEGPDLAIASLDKEIQLDKYPIITDAVERCDASIVAFGAGVIDGASANMFRKKSGEGCIKGVTSNFLIRFGNEVGMCFGDSGGPIFKNRGSDEIVGILTSGLVETDLKTIKCDPANTGLAMTANYFADFIASRGEDNGTETQFRVLETKQVENLSQTLREFILASDGNTGTSVVTDDDSKGRANSTLLLVGIATITLVLILIASRIRNVL